MEMAMSQQQKKKILIHHPFFQFLTPMNFIPCIHIFALHEKVKHILWRNFISVSYLSNLGSRALQHNKVFNSRSFSREEKEREIAK